MIVDGFRGQPISPQRFAMLVSGTALAPRATATLTRTPSGRAIHLTVTGLPHIAHGRSYEGWLQDPTGELVAIGTFNDARAVTLWAGVSPAKFTAMAVTAQRSGASPGESRLRVLVGTRTRQGP